MPFRKICVDQICVLHCRSVLSTHPTWPSRMDRQRGFHRRVLSSLLTQATATLPTAAWLKIRLLVQVVRLCPWPFFISRQTNLERHFSPFILSIHFNMRGLQPLSQHSFSSTTSNTPIFIMYSISSFRPATSNFGSIHVPSTHNLPSSCGVITFIRH